MKVTLEGINKNEEFLPDVFNKGDYFIYNKITYLIVSDWFIDEYEQKAVKVFDFLAETFLIFEVDKQKIYKKLNVKEIVLKV